jgi:transformation/transcription domain-associated protein
MTAVSIIGPWITENGQRTPLTKSEYKRFLLQLALLNFKRLPETQSHALSDMISCIVISMFGHEGGSVGLEKSQLSANHFFKDRVENGEILQKLLVSCLLSGNPHVRSLSIGIVSTQLNDRRLDDSIDTMGFSNGFTRDILVSLLKLDYEGIGGRLWTAVLVDVLLAACTYETGGVRLRRQGLNHQVFATHMMGHTLLPGFMRIDHKKYRSPATDGPPPAVIFSVNTKTDQFYCQFLKVIKSQRSDDLCGRGRCISAIRNLVHGDVDTCQSMLELCFQSVWQSLPDDQARDPLIKSIERLIAKPFHSQGAKSRHSGQINAVQSILRLLVRLRPMPFIDHFLLQSLAVHYNVRNEALSLIERRYISINAHVPNLDSSSHELIKAAQKCYDSLGDRDVSLGIYSAMAQLPGTKFALSLDLYDLANESTEAYLALIDRADGRDDMFFLTESEMDLWEARWVESHKELGQWSVVEEFASSTNDTTLMLECAWKTNNWEKVKRLCELPSVVASLEEGDPLTKITETYLAIHEGNLGEVENLHWQSAQLCLQRWNLMPAVTAGAHNSIFQQFQRLVELRESSQIAMETSSHSARRTIPDLKLLLNSWRHRLPNSFERVSQWNDIFLWRLQIFDAIARNFSWTNDQNAIATLHDRPFVCISLGRTSRKQGLKEVATYFLDSLESGIDVEYEFLKLREQILNYQFSSADSLKNGLNLVNSTNLSYFDSQQKAEIFRLKARFFYELNEKPKSNQAYCHAVQICPTYARTWVDWGQLCASLSDDAQEQVEDEKADSKELSKKTGLYLSQAMGCL